MASTINETQVQWSASDSKTVSANSIQWSDAISLNVEDWNGSLQVNADNAGTADFFRLFASDGTTCHAQGTVTVTGGGGNLTLDNTSIASGQSVTITTFGIADNNA